MAGRNSFSDRSETGRRNIEGQADLEAGFAAGKALYEERMKLLPGLWMPPAPPWSELPAEVRARWQRTAAQAKNHG
ncbi:hypothetical protein [Arthrobacter sp. 7Tela_A1]|uniref:hypothetical protein n=1 Tax=Arthrobacter sp. 7Tela_A1 TaxID=3093745 RepID=UPI003BB7FC83